MKKFVSIRKKLIRNNMIIIFVIFVMILLIITGMNIRSLNLNIQTSLENIRNGLIAKGHILVSNNSLAMSGLVEDYAITSVQALVSRTVEEDDDIIYGVYMDSENIPWVNANAENPKGNPKNSDPLSDDASKWAKTLKQIAYSEFIAQKKEIIEFAAPVLIDNEIVGFIRYGFSTCSMRKAVKIVKEEGIRTRNQTIIILIALGLLSMGISFIIVRRIANKMTSPILSLTEAAQIIANGDYTNSINVRANDEIGLLASHFENMRKTIKKYTDHLQDLVNEKMQQVRDILNNIIQGLFTINLDGNVNEEYSLRVNEILKVKDAASCSLAELLKLDSQKETSFHKWIKLVSENHKRMRWHKLTRLAPINELVLFNTNDNSLNYISIAYQKICDKSGELSKIMILVNDETETRLKDIQLEEERNKHIREVKMILAIANTPADEMAEFIDDITEKLKKALELIQKIKPEDRIINDKLISEIYRDIHTIKGNSGPYGFDILIENAHSAEEYLEELRKINPDSIYNILENLKTQLSKIEANILDIQKMSKHILGDKDDLFIRVPEFLVKTIQSLCSEIDNSKCAFGIDKLINECIKLSYKSVGYLAKKYKKLVNTLARKLNKKINFIVSNELKFEPPDIFTKIDDVLVHLLRNAVDHGIESNELREETGKGIGQIELSYEKNNNKRIYKIADDGKGIDVKKIAGNCIKNKIINTEDIQKLSDEEILHLIFHKGISLADKITDISGRGVGLDVVKNKIDQLGGTIEVQSAIGKGTTFIIVIPN
ncbi:MAG: HAMP domain-containing protein [Desulfobacterales bacterium]|nr:HAMP domain-containing protein [Desulfobacterales bacterium]